MLQYAFTLIKHNLFAETRRRAADKQISVFRQSCDIETSYSGVTEDASLMRCYTVPTDKYLRRLEGTWRLQLQGQLDPDYKRDINRHGLTTELS